MFRKNSTPQVEIEEVRPMVVTPTDGVVLRMSALAERIKKLDHELYEVFEEWKDMQSECIRVGITVDVLRSQALEAAYITWTAYREPDRAPTTVNEWPMPKELVIGSESAEYAQNGDPQA